MFDCSMWPSHVPCPRHTNVPLRVTTFTLQSFVYTSVLSWGGGGGAGGCFSGGGNWQGKGKEDIRDQRIPTCHVHHSSRSSAPGPSEDFRLRLNFPATIPYLHKACTASNFSESWVHQNLVPNWDAIQFKKKYLLGIACPRITILRRERERGREGGDGKRRERGEEKGRRGTVSEHLGDVWRGCVVQWLRLQLSARAWSWTLTPLFPSCVTLHELPNLSEPPLSSLQNRDKTNPGVRMFAYLHVCRSGYGAGAYPRLSPSSVLHPLPAASICIFVGLFRAPQKSLWLCKQSQKCRVLAPPTSRK